MKPIDFLKLFISKIKKSIKFFIHPKYYYTLESRVLDLEKKISQLKNINQKLKNDYIKLRKPQKIVVMFLIQELSLFSVFDSVIRRLSKNNKFQCLIVITPQYFCKKWNRNSYEELKKYFLSHNIEAIDGVCGFSNAGKLERALDLQGLQPHYVFYTCPYMEDYHPLHRCDYVHNFAYVCYIPYGFLLADQPETQYKQEIHRLSYRIYCETEFHKENYECRQDALSKVITTGYTKFDIIDILKPKAELIDIKSKFNKIIIIAPHWSISNISSITRYGTFEKYYKFIEDLLREFDDICFVFKPHPSLKNALSRTGILSLNKYNEIIQNWGCYNNFRFYDGADYFEYFAISDALVTDSVSFLAEYILFDKPVLVLTREDCSPYNKIGNLLLECFYKAGSQEDIRWFIEKVVLKGEDSMYQQRMLIKKVIKPFKFNASHLIEKDLIKGIMQEVL